MPLFVTICVLQRCANGGLCVWRVQMTTEKKQRRVRVWCIVLAVLLVLVGVTAIKYGIDGYTPNENYFGNGKKWSSSDSFAQYYQEMPTLQLAQGQTQLKIMQIADPQIKFGGFTHDTKTFDLLRQAFALDKPDVAVVSGDLTLSIFARDAVEYFCDFMEEQQVYWCFVYGNHDSEYGLSKYQHSQIFKKYKYCLFDGGPSNIKGESNYFVKVLDSNGNLAYAISLLDSNMYPDTRTELINTPYDEITAEQAEWYTWAVKGLQNYRADVKSSMFMHMPLRAYVDMYNDINDGTVTNYCGFVQEKTWTYENPFNGTKMDMPGIHCQTGNLSETHNGGGYELYNAVTQLGCTNAVFCGHDHINNLRGVDKNGILLAYGRCCGYHTYPFLDSRDDIPWLGSLLESIFDYHGAMMYMDEWLDLETGEVMGKGVSYIVVELGETNYGNVEMYDLAHFDIKEGNLVKQYVINN